MNTRIMPNGKVKYIIKYTDPSTGKRKDVSLTYDKDTARNRNEAMFRLTQIINQRISHISENVRLGELLDEYYRDLKLRVRESTYQRNHGSLEAMREILGEHTIMSTLTARTVRNRFIATGKANSTLNEYMVRFKSFIRWAYKADLLDTCKLADKLERLPDVSHREKISDKFMESEELRTLLEHMTIERWRLLTEFAALSGLRIGEIIALDKTDVDLQNSVIHVNKTYNPTVGTLSPPKTASSADDVYIQDELKRVINDINIFVATDKLMNQYRSALFLPGADGSYIHYYAFNKYFKENTKAVLGRTLTTHSLRHTHASLLFEQGFSENEVGRRLRHQNSQVTRDIYIHITDKLKEQDAAKLKKISLL